MDKALNREIQTLHSEKRMDELALKGQQFQISQMLNGSMGKDMLEVLNGEKTVELSTSGKIRNFLRRMLWNLGLVR